MPTLRSRKRKRYFRHPSLWRRLTARRRSLPQALIVGAQRAGTTSFFRCLSQHPQLVRSIQKEVHYFDVEENFVRGEAWYRAHFPTERKIARLESKDGLLRVVIEATPAYMFRDYVPARMKALVPDAKLIAVLRDPVTRALSNWKFAGEQGRQYGPFETEIEHELACESGRPSPLGDKRPRGLLARGRYAEQLERLWKHYPREQVLVVESADLFRDPTEFCKPIFRFLGLEPIPIDAEKRYNFSQDRTEIPPDLRARLDEYFAPHNQRLYELLGRDLGWGS